MNRTSTDPRFTADTRQDTILVVDDEVIARSAIAAYLRECEYKVIEAANSDEALVVLQRADIVIDVILSDIDLPGTMNGFALAQWARAHRPEIRIVLAGTIPQAAHAAGELCENGPAMRKPYEPQSVADRIRELLSKRRS